MSGEPDTEYALVADGRVIGTLSAHELVVAARLLRQAGAPWLASRFDQLAQTEGSGGDV
jgi:hypothetical protein